MSAERIELPPGDIDKDQVLRAVAALRRSELIVLPTETVYGLALRPGDQAARTKMEVLKGRSSSQALTHHVATAESILRLTPALSWRLQNLTDRYWPGPLTVIVEARDGGTVGVRLPAHGFTQAVIAELGEDLLMTSVNRSTEPPMSDPRSIEQTFAEQIALIFDAGPTPLGSASTIVRCTEPEYEVLREGTLSEAEVLQTASRLFVFVCTGNTCRSPLAEAIARQRLAQHWDCSTDAVLARGLAFTSAGVSTGGGSPTSEGSLAVAEERGLDLTQHCSKALTMDLASRAHHIYCLSESHRLAILSRVPELAHKLSLLLPDGDVYDPFGGDLDTYRIAARAIEQGIDQRLAEFLAAVE